MDDPKVAEHYLINCKYVNLLSANPTKWSNKLQQFVGFRLSVFDHFKGFVLNTNLSGGGNFISPVGFPLITQKW